MTATIAGFSTLSIEGIDLTANYTGYNQASAQSSTNDPVYPGPTGPFTLGQITKGVNESEWVYVLTGSALAVGDAVIITNTGVLWTATAITSTLAAGKLGAYVGVNPLVAQATGTYGWVQRAGKCAGINVLSSVSANQILRTTGTAGRLTSVVLTSTSVQISGAIITTAATTTGQQPAVLNYPVISTAD